MPDDYAYINTRVRVMRTRLLDGRNLEAALVAGSYPEFLRALSETDLAADLREATGPDAGLPELDRALSQNLFNTTQKVLRLADGRARQQIEVLLMKWDLVNLKTIARGIIAGRSSADIVASLVPGGTFKPTVLQAAATATDLASAATTLAVGGHPLSHTLKAALQAYNRTGKLLDLEVLLDQGFYEYALSVARDTKSKSLQDYVAREIDVTNALILRSQRGQAIKPELFVPGGQLRPADYQRIAGGDSGTGFIAPILEAPTLEEAELSARSTLDKLTRGLSFEDASGVGVIVDFLRRKEMEIAKLRLIGRGKFYQLPTEQLRKEVGA